MKNILQLFIYFLLLFSCSKNNETKKLEKVEPILLKIGYYPTFHQPAETILNLNEKYLIFIVPLHIFRSHHHLQKNMEKNKVQKRKRNTKHI